MYSCEIVTADGHRLSLKHQHVEGPLNVEDRRATCTPFVRALLAALAPRADRVTFRSGSAVHFAAHVVGAPLMGLLTAGLLLAGAVQPLLLLSALVSALVTWRLAAPLGALVPRTFSPAAPPGGLLPG